MQSQSSEIYCRNNCILRFRLCSCLKLPSKQAQRHTSVSISDTRYHACPGENYRRPFKSFQEDLGVGNMRSYTSWAVTYVLDLEFLRVGLKKVDAIRLHFRLRWADRLSLYGDRTEFSKLRMGLETALMQFNSLRRIHHALNVQERTISASKGVESSQENPNIYVVLRIETNSSTHVQSNVSSTCKTFSSSSAVIKAKLTRLGNMQG